MFICPVCHCDDSREALIDEVFCVDGSYFLVGGIPAAVCIRCGEHAIGRETAEKVRRTVRSNSKVSEVVPMKVLKFAS
jgi:HTH-type transcriptional regulator/antitoxin MqsA